MKKTSAADDMVVLSSEVNNCHSKWWKDPGLRQLNLRLLPVFISPLMIGYDGALIGGLLTIPQWYKDLGFSPKDNSLIGLMVAGYSIGGALMFWAVSLMGVGGVFIICLGPVLLTELAHPRQRGAMVATYSSFFYVGATASAWFTYGSLHIQNQWSWRMPVFIQVIPPMVQLPLMLLVPESPRWLMANGQQQAAKSILARYHANNDEDDQLFKLEYDQICNSIERERSQKKVSWMAFLQTPGNRWRLFIVIGSSLVSQWSGGGIITYYFGTALKAVGIRQPLHQAGINGGLQTFNFVVALVSANLVDRAGRRTLFLFSTTTMLLAMIGLTVATQQFSVNPKPAAGYAVVVLFFIFQLGFDSGYAPLGTTYLAEISSFHLRAKSIALHYFITMASAAIGQYANPYPDQAFALPSEPPIVILPHGLINRLKSAPERQLSADKEVCRRGLGQYTDLGTPMPEMFHAIQIDLTRHVRDLVPTLQNQVAYAFERHLRLADDQDWKEVTAFELVKRVVTILNATAFVGTELARNEEWQEIAYNYSSDLRRTFDALNSWHPWLRPFVHPFIFRHIGFSARRQRVAEMLRPLIRKNETSGPRTHTLLNYIMGRLPPKDRDDSRLMARMQLRAALAGSDTVAQALTNALFDIASDAGCAEQLRGEVSDLASATQDGRWDMTMLRSMSKLDSLLRESARLWAPFLLAMGRITTSPLRLDDGTVVPKDTTVYFDMYNAHRTPDKSHVEDMASFNGLRFSEWRERDKLPNKYLAATTGADNLPFGHGMHSCPGRFFAVAEMKVVLCHLLLEYEFKLPSGERPPTGYWGVATVMDRQAKMMIRRRRSVSE
ncbi:Cytochrome P450 monooxygenase BOA7 [Colletotrichum trifolii]|uniref:Cytochrome P450 monooxygenase BOA7 n=1 Tax=Colletotrichum trifolii TaxID=5466 RepID=A0A4R8RKY9_COLTR|nr:Cytochrome P450 monooxygenase BOA7 [Colletotrichum trifolii]